MHQNYPLFEHLSEFFLLQFHVLAEFVLSKIYEFNLHTKFLFNLCSCVEQEENDLKFFLKKFM